MTFYQLGQEKCVLKKHFGPIFNLIEETPEGAPIFHFRSGQFFGLFSFSSYIYCIFENAPKKVQKKGPDRK